MNKSAQTPPPLGHLNLTLFMVGQRIVFSVRYPMSVTRYHSFCRIVSGADPGFQVRGGALKNLRRAEGGANIFWVFRVKNHDFTQKNHIFSICGGRRENCWGISCEKSRFYAKKSYFFPILGGRAPGAPPLWIRP
jgi:hypothetical protein